MNLLIGFIGLILLAIAYILWDIHFHLMSIHKHVDEGIFSKPLTGIHLDPVKDKQIIEFLKNKVGDK